MTMFSMTKRTGKYRIIKVTGFDNEVHYELQWEITAVIGGNSWETEKHEQRPMKFSTELQVLSFVSFVNDAAQAREVVREGELNG